MTTTTTTTTTKSGKPTSSSRRSLVIRSIPPALRHREGPRSRDHALGFKIGFIAHDDDGDVFVVFDADDLIAQLGEFREAALAGDGEDEEESLAGFHV